MKIQMIGKVSGTRNEAEWPEPGEVIELPDDEARDLIGSGMATDQISATDNGHRKLESWETPDVAHGEYPDETNRTGGPLVDRVGEHTEAGAPTVNGDHLSDAKEQKEKAPVVPDDARQVPPVETKAKRVKNSK